MQFLVVGGALLTLLGLGGLGWCILQGFRIRRGQLSAEEIRRRLNGLIALNLGSVALAGLGLAVLVAGLVL